MKATVFTKPNCSFCISAKSLLERKGISYDEKVLDVDFTREQLLELAPYAKTFPQIWLDEELVGGFTDLEKRLV